MNVRGALLHSPYLHDPICALHTHQSLSLNRVDISLVNQLRRQGHCYQGAHDNGRVPPRTTMAAVGESELRAQVITKRLHMSERMAVVYMKDISACRGGCVVGV